MWSMTLKVLESRRSKMSVIYEITKETCPSDFHHNGLETANTNANLIYGYILLEQMNQGVLSKLYT